MTDLCFVYGAQKCFIRYSVSINMCYCVQGWEQCVCLDMNVFYLGLVPEEERGRVESLEPFDEYEVGSLLKRVTIFLFCEDVVVSLSCT